MSENEKMPVGIQIARITNILCIVMDLVIAILLTIIAVPNFIKGAEQGGGHPNPALVFLFGIVVFAISCIPMIFLIILNKKLKLRSSGARAAQIVMSFLCLFFFPIGTILSLLVLYFMLFDAKTKEAF